MIIISIIIVIGWDWTPHSLVLFFKNIYYSDAGQILLPEIKRDFY